MRPINGVGTAFVGGLPIANRFAAAILGGYAFTYGFVALLTLISFANGLRFFEAQALAWMLSFLTYLGALLYGFTAGSTVRVWLLLGGGGGAMGLASWLLSRAIM